MGDMQNGNVTRCIAGRTGGVSHIEICLNVA